MSKLEELVPPLELCKMIPEGEFEDSAFIWDQTTSVGFWDGEDKDGNHIGGFGKIPHKKYRLRQNYSDRCRKHLKDQDIELDIFPAPTYEEILKVLNEQFDPKIYLQIVFDWVIDIVCKNTKTPQHILALMIWLKLKGIEYEK